MNESNLNPVDRRAAVQEAIRQKTEAFYERRAAEEAERAAQRTGPTFEEQLHEAVRAGIEERRGQIGGER